MLAAFLASPFDVPWIVCEKAKMVSAADLYRQKIYRTNSEPSGLEHDVAKALVDLEAGSKDLKADLHELQFAKAREVEIGDHKRAVVIFVPFVLHAKFKKIQTRLTRELEKKFSGKHILFVAERTILSTHYNRYKGAQLRPRSRTLTSVHNEILNDIVYPTEIVGKRTRVSFDGSRLLKVFLDPKEQESIDHKLVTFAKVYKTLTNKNVRFQFPQAA